MTHSLRNGKVPHHTDRHLLWSRNGVLPPEETEKGDRRIFVASDMHVGALSLFKTRAIRAVKHGIRDSDVAVINGDAFAGKERAVPRKWRMDACKRAVDEWAKANAWARQNTNPDARIHFLPGNHEKPEPGTPEEEEKFGYCAEFMEKLRDHAEAYAPHLVFHYGDKDQPATHRIGDVYFTHGHKEALAHGVGHSDKPDGWAKSLVCGMIGIAVAGTPASLIMNSHAHMEAIDREMERQGITGVKHVCFGHIHQPFCDKQLNGDKNKKANGEEKRYHNPGTAITLNPNHLNYLMFTQDKDGNTKSIERYVHPSRFSTRYALQRTNNNGLNR